MTHTETRWVFKKHHDFLIEPEVLAKMKELGKEPPEPILNLDNAGNAFVYEVDKDGETISTVCAVRPQTDFKRGTGHKSECPIRDERAAQIAREHNALPSLVEALEALDKHWTEEFPDGPDTKLAAGFSFTDDTIAIWRQVRAALALAKGE